jgi:hypothetical protein
MNKYRIPNNYASKKLKENLHVKIEDSFFYQKYYAEFNKLITDNIEDIELKEQIYAALKMVCLSAEKAAYEEGFEEGLKFITDVMSGTE